MPSTSPRLSLPYLQPAQAQKHVTHNEALQLLDAAVQLSVLSFGATQPPAAPQAGDVHALAAGAQGDWAGQDGRLALWDGTGWQFLLPREGWRAWDAAAGALRVWTDGGWRALGTGAGLLQDLDGLGVGTASDATNRLAVSAPATLLSHAGAGHQLKVNKAEATDTASLLFQSGWTGHAEMGLMGGLDFSLKVGDGAAWRTALAADRTTGVVTLPQGAVVNGPLTGAAVQSGPTDATPGRLLLAGAFGLGGPLPPVGNAGATDGSLAAGLHAYDAASGSAGAPAGVQRATLLHSRRADGSETQLLIVEQGSAPGLYPGLVLGRARPSGGAWSGWAAGSLQESGSNANGRWLRHQDGTQTCWHSLNTGTAADTLWTYPQPFASTAGLVVTTGVTGTTGTTALCARAIGKTASAVGLAVVSTSNSRVASGLDVLAIGRWY
ncbi:DUF2793 domain-containing protein [Rubellimicrobium roseum]|uniref:DUF2793 domain-containing protein n=1 Tax=Rubellimicrobium roseum TaxID=687525 RepID=A0A5C4NLI8_9RHOB|nr:DUF2793 domain-containing protein [Rubellimicrobium roseum]TNC74755.1 DUF2793 domain-containing protein [Rubellimicrobium roseum]